MADTFEGNSVSEELITEGEVVFGILINVILTKKPSFKCERVLSIVYS